MNQEQRRLVCSAMGARARQWHTRVGIGCVIALFFFSMTGLAFALSWLAVYASLQFIELRAFRPGENLDSKLCSDAYCWTAVAFIALNNTVFGAFAARQAFTGQELGLVSAALLIAGAIVNGVIVSAGSRHLTWASIGPQILCFSALSVATMSNGGAAWRSLHVAGASLLFVLAAGAASHQLARTLRTAEEGKLEAERANRAKSEFLANMSHEIRTPLNGVVGMADLLATSSLSGRDREMVDIIRASGETLTSLLSDILDMARIESGEIVVERAPYHLGDTIRSTCALHRLKADGKGLRLVVDVSDEADALVMGDAGRVRQVLHNLISNAVKFTSIGHVSVSARVHDQRRIRLTVTDSGIGFDKTAEADIFARFQQADGSITRRFGGTGLGLAISRELTGLMGGSMDCTSAPGLGSEFWLDLPFECARPDATSRQHELVQAPQAHEGLRVLVADDHAVNLKVVGLILEQIGAQVTSVEDGAQAVFAFESDRFDIVFMDMQMPVMDGLTAISEIRRFEERAGRRRTPILVLSANAMAEHVAAATKAGADGHVAKPIKAADLILAVQAATAVTGAGSATVRAASMAAGLT